MVFINIQAIRKLPELWPTRLNLAIMMFLACVISYMLRVNLSINILAMVKPSSNDNSTDLPDYGPRYEWSVHQQSLLLGSFFWGYLVTSLPGGILAERFGGTIVAGCSLAFSSLLAIITPFAAEWGFLAIFIVRFLTGFLGGVIYPAQHNLISKWAPPDEKGKFVSALMGGTFGTVITWPLSGLIVEHFGWKWAFFASGIFSGFVTILWFLFVADSPIKHKRILKEERDYIEKSLGDAVSKSKAMPPFKSLFLSLPFWALLVLHYGNMWGLSFLITAAPKFMSEALGFNLTKAGILSSLPYLARLLSAFVFGAVGDLIRRKNLLSVTMIRKSFCIFSHVIPGAFLIILAYLGKDPYICVAIMTLSLGFNGSATMTNLQNSQDLAPNYAGTMYGLINFIGTTPGFFSPAIVAHFTKDSNTIIDWRYVFIIGAGVYIIPAIFFAVFGSGKVQKWNEIKKEEIDSAEKQ